MSYVAGLGSNPEYLRTTQYKDASNLQARHTLLVKHAKATEPWYPWLAARVRWPAGGDVLEVGCGSGALWTAIAPLLPKLTLTLTDLSEGMVETAARAVAVLPNIDLAGGRQCDAQQLPFAGASFDVAVANHMLYHVPEPAEAAAELARVLRPEGTLLAATNGPGHLEAISDIQAEVYGTSTRELIGRRFGKENGPAILGRAFGDVVWHDHPGTLVCDEPEDVYGFIASTATAQESSPDKLVQLRQVIEARFRAGGGVIRTPIQSGCFVARGPHRTG